MDATEGRASAWYIANVAHIDLYLEAERYLDDVWSTFEKRGLFRSQNRSARKYDLVAGLSSRSSAHAGPPSHEMPPLYDDVIHDLPPEYSALPPLANRNSTHYAVPTFREKSQTRSSSLLRDPMLDVRIDFEALAGVREHKKKKPAAPKKATPPAAPPPPPPPLPPSGGDGHGGDNNNSGGDGGGDSGGAGDGNGDGGDGGGEDWGDGWDVSGKKDKKKKKEEEEEQERLAKEEEEKKAAEASAANNLSWADEGGGGDASWAGFASVGKKKKVKVKLIMIVFNTGF